MIGYFELIKQCELGRSQKNTRETMTPTAHQAETLTHSQRQLIAIYLIALNPMNKRPERFSSVRKVSKLVLKTEKLTVWSVQISPIVSIAMGFLRSMPCQMWCDGLLKITGVSQQLHCVDIDRVKPTNQPQSSPIWRRAMKSEQRKAL